MILAAGLLVLIGLGTFVAGVVTDTTALYWVCVVACALAAALLVLRRVGTSRGVDVPAAASAPARSPASGGHRAVGGAGSGSGEQRAVRGPAPGGHRAADGVGRPAEDERRAQEEPAVPEAREDVPAWEPVDDDPPTGAHAAVPGAVRNPTPDGEPGEEDVEVTDLLLVVDLADEVLVVDEHPRYHAAGCVHLSGRTAIPLPMVEARADGFTPCGACRPVRKLAEVERSRRRAARGY
ncbi:hypothetical protein ACI784_10350 [Geodermatophilus sp. SYSU D01186]